MPKSPAIGGPTYAGHTDVSPPGQAEPDWQPAPDPATEPVPVVEAEPAPRKRIRRSSS